MPIARGLPVSMLNANPRPIFTPSFDLGTVFPFLAPVSRTAVLLRPVRTTVSDPFASKFGGIIAWPRSEQWPRCPYHSCPYVPVLQLHRDHFPQIPFPNSKDLLQILWCPEEEHPEAALLPWGSTEDPVDDSFTLLLPLPTFRWWNAMKLADQELLEEMPAPTLSLTGPHMPYECGLNPVEVVEYPCSEPLITSSQLEQVQNWIRINGRSDFEAMDIDPENPTADFAMQFSVAPGSKVGGFEYVTQHAPKTKCPHCDSRMSHLFTIASSEYGERMAKRWHPYDQNGAPLPLDYNECSGICIGDLDHYFAHVCLSCDDRPIIFQSSV
ncbi:YwqG-like protein [Gracilaria domingensis]|nr:YwqG-like protein [Gracilaria domingensis]